MSDAAGLFWRGIERGFAPYAERADARESATDRRLLAAGAWLRRPFSSGLRRARLVADLTEQIRPEVEKLGEAALREHADELRVAFLRRGFENALVARAFALVRTAAQRQVGMTHFPVQLMGGCLMLQGMLAEMETGEGKTLTASLPAAAAALTGMSVHVITVNDYLAERDGELMRPVYQALGLSVGITRPGQQPAERQAAYAADITYCTNKDIGFDYLRDGLTLSSNRARARLLLQKLTGSGDALDRLLLRGLHFAIVDEADSVLIDEARTPLVISGAGDAAAESELYQLALGAASGLEPEVDFVLDRKDRAARLTNQGRLHLKALSAGLPAAWRSARAREELAQQALAAKHLFDLDVHYLVRDGKVMIVDEYTGRVMPDRSWERGLQQLIEVKEGCEVTGRRATLARITYQRLFRRYLRLSGMTGTAIEVAPELEAVYGLRVARVPTNRPVARTDLGTRLYADRARKWDAVVRTLAQLRGAGRPVLVGSRSVAASEELCALLAAQGLPHVLLNARQDREEADIIAAAGIAGRITVATNMAGRGTDIRPEPGVLARGGLHVVLTEFHESGRIDRQLFGRGGRQGDPGSHEAIVSLDDGIFRRYARAAAGALEVRYAGASSPLPAWAAMTLQGIAQHAAETANSRDRRATMELDRRLDTALAFAGSAE
ncbi:MAG: hypothetical protein A3H35_11375 [Betaproteobacteria bacterium RIFCSPLOWO2_02_FULL_62_17]|nr:MAG: hypothetical protein A3H35_11375 [Betaproteobacteria bacterium RIFCSPLOWO2_02_FULL_62_17]